MPNGRCEVHGGKTPIGIASPNLRTGRYSKSLPARLSQDYEQALADPDLLSIREDVALLDSRLADVLAAASNHEAGELWANLKAALKEYDGARGKDIEQKRSDALANIRWLINEGYQEWQAWRDIRALLQERKSLVESERDRLKQMQLMITTERANVLLGAIAGIIRTHVTDRTALTGIAADMRRLVSAEPRG
jgi:hypothetical protein